MFSFLQSPIDVLIFLTVLTALVAAHELGHYLFARIFKMEVEEFAIGFGPKKWVYARKHKSIEAHPNDPMQQASTHETEFTLRPFPLGGFVRIKGMVPDSEAGETRIPNGFYSRAPWKRILVLFAGPLFSVLAGYLVLIPLYTVMGRQAMDTKPYIGQMDVNGAGGKAGLKLEDEILSLDGKPVSTFFEVVQYVRVRPETPIRFEVKRGNEIKTISAVPTKDKEPTPVLNADYEPTDERKIQGKLGFGPGTTLKQVTLGEATAFATSLPFRMLDGMLGIVKNPARLKTDTGGVVTMFMTTKIARELGLVRLLEICGFLSISIGVFNLLPIGMLDGSQMLIATIEMLRGGKRLSLRIQEIVIGTGAVMLVALIITITVFDIERWFGPKDDKGRKIVTAPQRTEP